MIDQPTFIALSKAIGADAAVVVSLHMDKRLGYLAASDEWTDRDTPLPEQFQDAAHHLQQAGMLPEFNECFQ